jgi:plasmid maintenance system antidote protein VapI
VAGVKRALQKPRRKPRRPVGVSRYIADELAARQWSARRLAVEMDCPLAIVDGLLGGEPLTVRVAAALARALGTSTELWLEVEAEVREREIKKYGQPGHW